jgi:acetolactate synthase regulatory subunit
MSKVAKYVERRVRKELSMHGEKVSVSLVRTPEGIERVRIVLDDRGVTATAAIQVDKKAVICRDLNVNIGEAARRAFQVLESAISRKVAESQIV